MQVLFFLPKYYFGIRQQKSPAEARLISLQESRAGHLVIPCIRVAAAAGFFFGCTQEMLSCDVPDLTCPHPATQHLCHWERPGCMGRQMGSLSSLNVMGLSSISRAMSLSMLTL